jgi:hypothetical protein
LHSKDQQLQKNLIWNIKSVNSVNDVESNDGKIQTCIRNIKKIMGSWIPRYIPQNYFIEEHSI